MNNTKRTNDMTSKHRLLAIALLVIVFPFLLWLAGQRSKDFRKVDYTITVNSVKPFHFIDDDGRDVGQLDEFEGELTVVFKRVKP